MCISYKQDVHKLYADIMSFYVWDLLEYVWILASDGFLEPSPADTQGQLYQLMLHN